MALIRNFFLFSLLLVLPLFFTLNSNAQELVVNGSFESGNSNGWSVSPDGSGATGCGYFVYSGTQSFWDNSIQAPPDGNFAASSDTLEPPCSSVIYQDITVPAGAKVSCSLIYYYVNFGEDFINGPGLNSSNMDDPNQQARIDIMNENAGPFATGDGVLKNLFRTEPGDPLTLDYTTLNFDLTEYAGTTVKIRAAQANNQEDILFAIDAVSCTVEDLIGDDEVSSVPTLSQWGMIAMACILGIVGFIIATRRKATA